jgi:hypothetical protein
MACSREKLGARDLTAANARIFPANEDSPIALRIKSGASSAQDFPTEHAPWPEGTCFHAGAGWTGGNCAWASEAAKTDINRSEGRHRAATTPLRTASARQNKWVEHSPLSALMWSGIPELGCGKNLADAENALSGKFLPFILFLLYIK